MKVFSSSKCLQAREDDLIGGKRHLTNQSQNYMANRVIWLLKNRRESWEGRRRKIDSSGDSERDSDR